MHNASAVRMQSNLWMDHVWAAVRVINAHIDTLLKDSTEQPGYRDAVWITDAHALSEQTNQSCDIKSLKNNKTKHKNIGVLMLFLTKSDL